MSAERKRGECGSSSVSRVSGAKTLASGHEDNEQCVDSVLRSVGTTEA